MGITISWSGHRGHLGTLSMNRNVPRGQAVASGRFSLFEPSGELKVHICEHREHEEEAPRAFARGGGDASPSNRMEMSRLQGKVPAVGAKEMVIFIAASTYNRHSILSFQCFILIGLFQDVF